MRLEPVRPALSPRPAPPIDAVRRVLDRYRRLRPEPPRPRADAARRTRPR